MLVWIARVVRFWTFLLLFLSWEEARSEYDSMFTSTTPARNIGLGRPIIEFQWSLQDANGNSEVDAGEKAVLVITIRNVGDGKAYDINFTCESAGQSGVVSGKSQKTLGTIENGGKATVKIDLKADAALEDGEITFSMAAKGKYGLSVLKTIKIPTRATRPQIYK